MKKIFSASEKKLLPTLFLERTLSLKFNKSLYKMKFTTSQMHIKGTYGVGCGRNIAQFSLNKNDLVLTKKKSTFVSQLKVTFFVLYLPKSAPTKHLRKFRRLEKNFRF